MRERERVSRDRERESFFRSFSEMWLFGLNSNTSLTLFFFFSFSFYILISLLNSKLILYLV